MRIIFFLVLLAGIGLSGFGVYMLSQKYGSDQAELLRLRQIVANQTELGPVVVTTEPLRYGKALQREHVRLVEWPLNARPENVFTSMEELFPEASPPRAILRGMRAYTITVDVSSGVSGFLNPGDRVDIFWSGRDQGQPLTKLMFENISLIAIDQTADEDTKRPIVARTVTVEVSPLTVAALAQAQSTGRLTLSLRGADDDGSSGLVQIDQNTLIGRVEEVVQEERQCFITVRKGEETVQMPTKCPETQ